MASKEAFIPLATGEDPETGVPTFNPNGPGSSSYAGSLSMGQAGDDGDTFPNSTSHHLLFCNCCCDHRRAVLAMNVITIVFKILGMIFVAVGASFVGKNLDEIEADLEDDEVRKELDGFVKEGGLAIVEILVEVFAVVSIGLHCCGIYGALNFKQWGIITAGSTYAISLLLGVITLDFGNIILSGLFLYPHIFMVKLMKEGVMTDYNYHKIASCCGNREM